MSDPLSASTPLAPLPNTPAIQSALDASHLQLLEIGFYISGVTTALRFIWLLFMAVFFAIIGFSASFAKFQTNNGTSGEPPPAVFFFFFAGFFGVIIFLTLIFAGLEIYAGICLKKRRHPILIQIVAALYCLSIPWGTALGVFTFIVLNRPTVRLLFDNTSLQVPPASSIVRS
jgi:hypothetical protein